MYCHILSCYSNRLLSFSFFLIFTTKTRVVYSSYTITAILSDLLKSAVFRLKVTLFPTKRCKGNHFDRSYQYRNDLLAPYNFARRPSQSARELASEYVLAFLTNSTIHILIT